MGTPPYIPYNQTLLRGATAPSQNAADFVNYFACSFSAALGASPTEAAQIISLCQKKMSYPNLAAYTKANPGNTVAANIQQLISTSESYDAFQSGLSQLYGTLNAQNDKDFVYSLSNSADIVSQSVLAGTAGKSSAPTCSGWWSCWGKCTFGIIGGVLGGGVGGALTGSVVPILGTLGGGIAGAIGGGISAGAAACN